MKRVLRIIGTLLAFGFVLGAAKDSSISSKPFASRIFHELAKDKSSTNLVFSPTSIETCLGLAYLGAEGATSNEIKTALQLSGDSKESDVGKFSKILSKSTNENAKLKIVNRIYVAQNKEIVPKFNTLAEKYFRSIARKLNFSESKKSADEINAWVEAETENKIKNLIEPTSLDVKTQLVIVNAIYFKSNWTNSFEIGLTQKKDFLVSSARKVTVDMMHQSDYFLYGELPELDAKAVELGYEGTDISMLIVLPKSLDGLASLEAKMHDVDLIKLSDHLKRQKVNLRIPKFKIEFDTALLPVLKQLGMKTMFTPEANFEGLLTKDAALSVSEVKHKAFIEVNEKGTEAAAATYIKIGLESLLVGETVFDFTADHPFVFVIKDSENVYFAGHIVNL